MLRIFHGADLHLDTPFTALPPQLAGMQELVEKVFLINLHGCLE